MTPSAEVLSVEHFLAAAERLRSRQSWPNAVEMILELVRDPRARGRNTASPTPRCRDREVRVEAGGTTVGGAAQVLLQAGVAARP